MWTSQGLSLGPPDYESVAPRVIGTGTLVHSFGSMNMSVCHEVHIYIYKGLATFHIRCSRNCQ